MQHKLEYKTEADAGQLKRFLSLKNIEADVIVKNNKEVIITSTENQNLIQNALDEYIFDEQELKNYQIEADNLISKIPKAETEKEKYLKLITQADKLEFVAKQLGLTNAF